MRKGAMLSLLVFLLAVGCAVERGKVYVKDGKRYGVTSSMTWRSRWWDYYERGTSYAAGVFWDEAIADFQAAILQRHADQRHAVTYGMHLIDYFPHRELGIVYYRLGRHAAAIRELETSLHSVETAKTKFYLNKARRSLLEQTQRDTAAPRLVLDSPSDRLLTNRFSVMVAGYAEDDTYVSAVAINGRARFIELAEPRLTFIQEVALRDGANFIDVVAEDLVGRQAHRRLTVHLDRHGPLLSLDRVEVIGVPPQQRARVQGLLTDHSRITRFALAGRAVPLQPGTTWEFRLEVPITPGATVLPFEAEDTAGNVNRSEIVLRSPAGGPPGIREGTPAIHALPRWATLPLDGVVADLPTGRPMPRWAIRLSDREPPVITLFDVKDRETVYDDTIYIAGQVTDASAITAFTINGESLWRRKTQQLFFSQYVQLHPGENHLALQAVDEAGNTTQRTLVVMRQERPVERVGSRLRLFLMPFAQKGQTSVLTEATYDHSFDAFVKQRRFDMVERLQLEVVLQELKLSQSALVDPATAAKIGKIVGAEVTLIGTVTAAPPALEIFIRLVDVETSVVLAAEDIYGEDLTLRTLRTLMEGLAWKMQQHFPLVEGLVMQKEDNDLLTDLTARHGIRQYMKLIVFRPGQEIKHPRTGRLLTTPETILAEAQITAVSADLSKAILLPSTQLGDVQALDMVITK